MTKKLACLGILLIMNVVNSVSYSAQIRDGELILSLEKRSVLSEEEAQELTVTVWVNVEVKDIPAVYGVDVALVFDAQKLQVIDVDKQRPGIQVAVGPFLKADRSFLLRNQADNRAGRFEYTMSLLNPAPEVKGDGLLLQIPIQLVAPSVTAKIAIEKIEFGTRSGDTVIPELKTSELVIGIGEKPTKEFPYLLIAILVGVLILLSITVLWVVMRKRKKSTDLSECEWTNNTNGRAS
jgi:hypothetical protein